VSSSGQRHLSPALTRSLDSNAQSLARIDLKIVAKVTTWASTTATTPPPARPPRLLASPPSPPVSVATQNVENTISPIDCSGKTYPVSKPFLLPPYHGFVQIDSYFDHDLPDFTRDGLLDLANGVSLTTAGNADAPLSSTLALLPMWSQSLRQYVYYDGHNGYDFQLVYQPVYAAAAGKILFAGWNYPGLPTSGYGQLILINHGHGYSTLYGHLSKIQVYVGERVRAGQQIAISGNTGHSTGPHLHFSVFHNCDPTDPYGWTGKGPDPLESYQGETSAFLWRKVPKILNPIPGWPGVQRVPAPTTPEALDLTLPLEPTAHDLLAQMDSEQQQVATELAARHIPVHYDWAAAAFLFPHPVRPGLLVSLPFAAAVTPEDYDDLYWATQSLATTLTRLVGTIKPTHELVDGRWRVHILRYGAQTYVWGHGPANHTVELQVLNSSVVPTGTVTSAGGAFVLPVQSGLSSHSRLALVSTTGREVLSPKRHRHHAVHRSIRAQNSRATRSERRRQPQKAQVVQLWAIFAPGALVAGFLALFAWRFLLAKPKPNMDSEER
jgi:murein DD-endopeptidase MepM/ murein hydrolase activator NlpD